MTNPVAAPTPIAEPAAVTATPAVPHVGSATGADTPAPESQSDFRLFIEKDENAGVFVYRIVNRMTGDVVQQFPREEVLRLMDDPQYGPGAVIDARS